MLCAGRLVKGERKTGCMRPDEVVTASPLTSAAVNPTTFLLSTQTLLYDTQALLAYQLFVRPFGPVKYPL